MIDRLVSAIVPVFNRPRLLEEAIGSVVAQTYRPIEIIVVDDGSTDETPRTCAALVQQNPDLIRSIRIENSGPGLAREAGRLLAQGEFIQYLDSDDLLHPSKFERQVAALRSDPECGAAYCKTREYQLGQPPNDKPVARTGASLSTLFPQLLSGRCWYTPSPLFRRGVTDEVGPWTDLRQEEDVEYDARVAALGTRLVWCPEFLADVRHHADFRAGGGSLGNPAKMRWRHRAHVLVFQHARRFGIGSEDPHMQHYARELFLLARQCGASGLSEEAQELFDLAREAAGQPRGAGLDFRLYRLAASVLGWRALGRFACWSDRFRPRATN